jgi:hypothetical protein
MKILSMIMCFLTVILTAGCSQVVYRVNPDSPPKMGIEEAKNAIELTLSLVQKQHSLESIKMEGDNDLVILSSSRSIYAGRFTATLGDISREIRKQGAYFGVDVFVRSIGRADSYEIIYWKLEEDARLFVDAVHALRQGKLGKKPVTTHVAASSSPSPQKKMPKEALPDTTSKKDTHVVLDQRPKVQTSTKAPDAKTPLSIVITSPDLTRALTVVARKSTITVTGRAESAIGIADVFINGQQADIDEKGLFSADIMLKVGENPIVVKAVDIRRNEATKQFILSRESGKIIAVKPEAVEPETGLRAAQYYALFIAVADYDSHEINKLDHPVSDAKRLMDTLVSKYTFRKENVLFLQNPDRRAIYKSFQDLRKRLTEKDNLLVFYAGHGTWLDDMQQGFWLPRDAAGVNDPTDWISNGNVRDYLKSIKAKHILLVTDACFSGGIFKVRTAFADPRTSMEKIYELPSRKAITSGSLKTVPDRSVFVDFLIKRLRDNRESYLDTQRLFASLREAVINNSPTHQTPLYGAINEAGDEGGDFVFVKRQ